MEARGELERLARLAERILRERREHAVLVEDPALLARRDRSLVVRCTVQNWDGVESIVLKRNDGDEARGFTEWASLAFLATLVEADGVAPRFHAGDCEARLLVMEDLGPSRSLENLLAQADTPSIRGSLTALAACMAQLVAATVGRETTFQRIRAELPGAEGLGRQQEAGNWLAARARVTRWATALDLPLPTGFDMACERIATVYAEPGAYLAFSHGDPAPSNNHISPDRACLVDFEYACYRHALYDLTAWDILCPLPRPWVAEMETVFRRSAGAGALAEALGDDRRYQEALATLRAFRALAMIGWLPPELLLHDRDWVPGWTQRPALISTALRLQRLCAGVPALEPVAELGGLLAAALQARWPECGEGELRWPGVA